MQPVDSAAAIITLPEKYERDWDYLKNLADLRDRVTAYFGYFIAKVLGARSWHEMTEFVRDFYGPIAAKFGTIHEKTNANAGRAHGRSVGVAGLIVDAASDQIRIQS